ncbi:hypothetical protein [Glutamicibacter protophormiae]|uniref:hypothetical protein n=1 Tax=Glutamicibacter protophormiae TaxID=37930 RepID=UPI003A93CED9
MFERDTSYPTAVASNDDEGVDAAIEWCLKQMKTGDTFTVWTSLKSNLKNCTSLERLVQRYDDVVHITGRGGEIPRAPGPVLMVWPDIDEIGQLVRFARQIRALCIITWNADGIRPWVTAMKPEVLGDGSDWEKLSTDLDPVVIEALRSLTLTINHNNTISAGYEKDQVVSVLLALKEAHVSMDADAMQGWVLAHGWSGKNPERLARYVQDINDGKRPRAQRALRADYVDNLRKKATPVETNIDESEG